MSLYQDVRGALQQRLETVAGLPAARAYEGVKFTPVAGTPFVVAILAPASDQPITVGDQKIYQHTGTFEVSVCFPAGNGTAAAEQMADAIRASFQSGDVLTLNGSNIRIRFAQRKTALQEPDWIRIPVSIGWFLHSRTN